MKKMIVILITLFSLGSISCHAHEDKPITVEELPAKAQQFIRQHFPNEKIAFAKSEREFLDTKYEVVLANSIKIEFLKNGEWKEIDCRYSTVPAVIVPTKINTKAKELYPNATIVRIERESRGYEVKLNNGLELGFNASFNLIDIDD